MMLRTNQAVDPGMTEILGLTMQTDQEYTPSPTLPRISSYKATEVFIHSYLLSKFFLSSLTRGNILEYGAPSYAVTRGDRTIGGSESTDRLNRDSELPSNPSLYKENRFVVDTKGRVVQMHSPRAKVHIQSTGTPIWGPFLLEGGSFNG